MLKNIDKILQLINKKKFKKNKKNKKEIKTLKTLKTCSFSAIARCVANKMLQYLSSLICMIDIHILGTTRGVSGTNMFYTHDTCAVKTVCIQMYDFFYKIQNSIPNSKDLLYDPRKIML